MTKLEFENLQVLFLVQALSGLMSQTMRAVTIKCSESAVDVRFVLYHEDPDCREDIEDIIFELDTLQVTSGIKLNANVLIDNRPIDELEFPPEERIVFLRKD